MIRGTMQDLALCMRPRVGVRVASVSGLDVGI